MAEAANGGDQAGATPGCKTFRLNDRRYVSTSVSTLQPAVARTNTDQLLLDPEHPECQETPQQKEQREMIRDMHKLLPLLPDRIVSMMQSCLEGLFCDNTQALHQQIHDLATRNASLMESHTTLEGELLHMKSQVEQKNAELQSLHEIVIKSGHQTPEQSDKDVSAQFSSLEHEILCIALRHYQIPPSTTDAVSGMTNEDCVLFFRSQIASLLKQDYFHTNYPVFGLEPGLEDKQQNLYAYLSKQHVPESELVNWRNATIAASAKVDRSWSSKLAFDTAHEYYETLKSNLVPQDKNACILDMQDLIKHAWQISLGLGAGNAIYCWDQLSSKNADRIPADHVDTIGPWNVKDQQAPLRPSKVLFGPVYKKTVDGKTLLIRKGQILMGE